MISVSEKLSIPCDASLVRCAKSCIVRLKLVWTVLQLVTDLRWCTYTCKVLAEQHQCVIVVEFIVYSLLLFFFLTRELEGWILLAIVSAIRAKPSWFYVSHKFFWYYLWNCWAGVQVACLWLTAAGAVVNPMRTLLQDKFSLTLTLLRTLGTSTILQELTSTSSKLSQCCQAAHAAFSGGRSQRKLCATCVPDQTTSRENLDAAPICCYVFLVFRCKMKGFFKHWNALLPC